MSRVTNILYALGNIIRISDSCVPLLQLKDILGEWQRVLKVHLGEAKLDRTWRALKVEIKEVGCRSDLHDLGRNQE